MVCLDLEDPSGSFFMPFSPVNMKVVMLKVEPRTLKGFRDFLPGEARKRQYVQNILKGVFESFGFEPLETPTLEYEDILSGKYGEEGDRLMYKFEDQGGRKVALRYDQTVPLARVAAQYTQLPKPFKRYQIQNVFRAENTQKGRFREFLQCDIDTVGTTDPLSDAEILAVVAKSFQKLGFKNFKILINDRNIFSDLTREDVVRPDDVLAIIRSVDKLKKIGQEAVLKEIENLGYPKADAIFILESIEKKPMTQTLEKILEYLDKLGVPENLVEFSPTLARGLDYYTGLILEVECPDYPAGSLGGGGRYDNLLGIFGKGDLPAVGFAFGFDRIIEAMEALNLFPEDLPTTKALVTIFSPDLVDQSLEVSSRLRSNNISVEIYLDTQAKLEKQLKYADQNGIPYAVIIGPEEAKSNQVVLKDLRNRTQEILSLDEAVKKLDTNNN